MTRTRSAILLAAALAAPLTLSAQHPQTRRGFWISFGWGYGSGAQSCDSCTSTGREGALSGYLRMGGRLGDHLLLGGETNGFVTKARRRTRGNLSLAAYYYVKPRGGLFVKAGVGLSAFSTRGYSPDFSGTGPGFTIGVGNDIRVRPNISLTPAVNLFAGSPKPTTPGLTPPANYKQNVIQFVLGVTFH